MKNVLVIVDVQNDFVTGTLGTKESNSIPQKINDFLVKDNAIEKMDLDLIIATVDTHGSSTYQDTLEGKLLPVGHCFEGTDGIRYAEPLRTTMIDLYNKSHDKSNNFKPHFSILKKHTFGSTSLHLEIDKFTKDDDIIIYICGLCTNICVISNALLLRAHYPNAPIYILKDLCAGTTIVGHHQAINVMTSCQCTAISNEVAIKGPMEIEEMPL